jgi:hypothetical protein
MHEVLVTIIGLLAGALIESAVEQQAVTLDLKEVLTAGDGVGCPMKGNVHVKSDSSKRM